MDDHSLCSEEDSYIDELVSTLSDDTVTLPDFDFDARCREWLQDVVNSDNLLRNFMKIEQDGKYFKVLNRSGTFLLAEGRICFDGYDLHFYHPTCDLKGVPKWVIDKKPKNGVYTEELPQILVDEIEFFIYSHLSIGKDKFKYNN